MIYHSKKLIKRWGRIMRKIVCILSIVVLLIVVSLTVFATPHAVQGTRGFSVSSCQSFFSDNIDFLIK